MHMATIQPNFLKVLNKLYNLRLKGAFCDLVMSRVARYRVYNRLTKWP